MASTNVRMHGPSQVSNVATTKYTVPTGQVAVLKHIHAYNPSSDGVTFTLAVGADAASNRIYDKYTIGGQQSLDVFCKYILTSGEILQAFSGTNNILMLTLDGQLSPAAVAGASNAYTALYDVDFRTLPNQSLAASGSHTVDGKTWWMKGALGTAGVTEIVNGQGFHFSWPFNGTYPTDYGGWRSYSWSPHPRTMLFPLAQLAGYNPKAPLAILVRTTSVNAPSEDYFFGVIDHAANSSPITTVEHDSQMTMCKIGTTSTWFTSLKNGDTRDSGGIDRGPTLDSYVLGMLRMLDSKWYPLIGQWTGTLTKPDDYNDVTTNNTDQAMPTRCSGSPSFVWAFSYTNSSQPAMNAYLTHLKIMQPKAI